jgi:hypothetical protein
MAALGQQKSGALPMPSSLATILDVLRARRDLRDFASLGVGTRSEGADRLVAQGLPSTQGREVPDFR